MRLIDADDAIEAITNYAKFLWDNYHETCHLAGMIDAIDSLPTIDPVKHGRWVMQGTAYGCSLCGEGVIHPFHNYCPNCGARMAEGEEG